MDDDLYRQLYRLEDHHWWFSGRRAVIAALLARAGGVRGALLDAGCGTGRNLQEFGPPGARIGIDPSQDAVDFCHARGLDDVQRADVTELPFADGAFATLMALDVIEHVDDDAGALRELRRVAERGATLIVTTPAYQWLWSHHDETHHHKRRYTRPALLVKLRDAGWLPRDATYFNTVLLPAIGIVRLVARARAPARTDYELTNPRVNSALERVLRAEAAAIRRGASLPAGVSIGISCSAA